VATRAAWNTSAGSSWPSSRAIGRRIEARVTLDQVTATLAGDTVAAHRRAWGRHQVITDADHVAARSEQRQQRQQRDRAVSRDTDVETRDLTVYDQLGAA
jgi:hypothetical protein